MSTSRLKAFCKQDLSICANNTFTKLFLSAIVYKQDSAQIGFTRLSRTVETNQQQHSFPSASLPSLSLPQSSRESSTNAPHPGNADSQRSPHFFAVSSTYGPSARPYTRHPSPAPGSESALLRCRCRSWSASSGWPATTQSTRPLFSVDARRKTAQPP